jgi:hypothetical protein
MKSYVAAYLRDRDLRGFREILLEFTRPSFGHVRRVLTNVFGVLVPAMMERFPSLTEREMWELAVQRIAELEFPAELPGSMFELTVPQSEPVPTPRDAPHDELSPNCPRPSPRAAAILRRFVAPRVPRPEGPH